MLLIGLPACFWIDPIVERPKVQVQVVQPETIYRGSGVTLAATFVGETSGPGTYDWKLRACVRFGINGADGCDAPFYTASATRQNMVDFSVPVMNAAGTDKVQAIKVELVARSDRGAVAEASGQSGFPVLDAPPRVMLDRSALTYTVGAPIDLFAKVGDADDDLDDVSLAWVVTPDVLLEDLEVATPIGPGPTRTAGKRLVPTQPGPWDVAVTARDPLGVTLEQHMAFMVEPDKPPCLAQWQPIVPPPGQTLPVTGTTVFQVPLVADDLDGYPRVSDLPQFRTAQFEWSILPPHATQRTKLTGATANRFELDPAAFSPGDIVELRVEVFDHNHVGVTCPDAEATCSIAASPSCIQRQTWRVEVR